MTERTEDLALRGVLPLSIGGEPVELATLTLDESDEWLALLAAVLARIGIEEDPSDTDGSATIRAILTAPAQAVVGLVAAYDVEGKLGGADAIRGRMSKRELKAAMDAMVAAEDPFGEDAARSVAEGFGAPSRLLAQGIRVLADTQMWSALAASTTGPSDGTASTTATSGPTGARSSSSSAGTTRKRRRKSG